MNLREAYALCTRIRLPPYELRCAGLAETLGIALTNETAPLRVDELS